MPSDLFDDLYNRKIAYCDTVWHNKRNAPKCWPQDPEKEEMEYCEWTIAMYWNDKRGRYVTLITELQVNKKTFYLVVINYFLIQKMYGVKLPNCNSGNDLFVTLSLQRKTGL
jgi:hypothetical protein